MLVIETKCYSALTCCELRIVDGTVVIVVISAIRPRFGYSVQISFSPLIRVKRLAKYCGFSAATLISYCNKVEMTAPLGRTV
jgi:hypothetical protein